MKSICLLLLSTMALGGIRAQKTTYSKPGQSDSGFFDLEGNMIGRPVGLDTTNTPQLADRSMIYSYLNNLAWIMRGILFLYCRLCD